LRTAADNKCSDSLRQTFMSRAMSKGVKIKIYKMMVKPAVVFGSETVAMAVTGGYEQTECMGEGNIEKGTWTNGTARNMESKN